MKLLLFLAALLPNVLSAASSTPVSLSLVNKYLEFPLGTAAATPATTGKARLYCKTGDSTHLYLKGSDGIETTFGSGGGGGIASINSDTSSAQTIAVGSSGTDFAVSTAAGVTTLSLPAASATAAGKVTTGTQTFAGAKTFSTAPACSSLTANTVPYVSGTKQLASSVVTPTELSYVSGVTSAIQTQIDAKQDALTIGNVTASGGVTQSGGTGAVMGAGVAIACTASADGTTGCLTGTDHTSFTGLHLEQLDGQVETPANKTYILRARAQYSGTINSIYIATASGTITAAVAINAINVTGLGAISVTSTPQTVSATGTNTFASGDQITLVTTANSTSADLYWSLKVTRN